MENATRLMREHLEDSLYSYVFPSEVVAAQTLKRLLRDTAVRVLARNKCISWDKFKEETLIYPTDSRPVNDAIRTLFLTELLEANRAHPFFHSLIRPEYAAHSQVLLASLRRFLPLLKKSEEIFRNTKNALLSEKYRDLSLLHSRYAQFLKDAGLFEPNYLTPFFEARGKTYIIFFPETIADFESLLPFFENNPRVILFPTDSIGGERKKEILVFPTIHDELRGLMNSIHALLEEGVRPDEIVITAGNLPELVPALETQAALYDIKIHVHEGKPLLYYPGLNFLAMIERLISSNWNFQELKSLLYNRSVPWKADLPIADLISFGFTYNCVRDYIADGSATDIWEYNFRRLREGKQDVPFSLTALSSFHHALRKSSEAIHRAKTFSALKRAVSGFAAAFFDSTAFGEWERKHYELALSILDELDETLKTLPLKKNGSPFALWLSMIEATPYVPPYVRQGIVVYPYRVSAGILPAHHFIVNASEAGTRTIIKLFPFLAIDEEAKLSLAEKDASNAFLSLYLASGDNVAISCSREGPAGIELPPPFFIENGTLSEPSARKTDSWAAEARFWKETDAAPPALLFSLQKSGLKQARRTASYSKKSNFTTTRIEDENLCARVLEKLVDKEGNISITPSDLEDFHSCPFRFLLKKTTGLAELAAEFTQETMKWYGTLLHRVFENFFQRLADSGGYFDKERIDQYKTEMSAVVRQEQSVWEKTNTIPIPPVWEGQKELMLEGFAAFLDVEKDTFGAYRIAGIEQTYSTLWKDAKLALSGKIDHIGERSGGLFLVDYKKKKTPRRSEIAGGRAEPSSFQIPFYVMLMDEDGARLEAAYYYSFENKRYEHVVNGAQGAKSFFSKEEMKTIVEATKEKIGAMGDKIRKGEFSIPKKDNKACDDCVFRPVCRNKYFLRF